MADKDTRQTAEDIVRLKDEFVKYFEDVPVQKYAAMAIGRTEQTVIVWMKEDEDFLNRVQEARSKWVKKKLVSAKAEFALERLEKDVFKETKEVEVTLPQPLLGGISVSSNDSNQEDSQPQQED